MARYTYDLFEPGSNSDESLQKLTKEFAPLHMEAWQKTKAEVFGQAYNMNVATFATMWLQKYLKIFMAYDDLKPAGYLTGISFKPLEYQVQVFQVEDWYTRDNTTVRDGLFDYLDGAIRILGCDEIRITYGKGVDRVDFGPSWQLKNEATSCRYVKV